MKTYQEQIADLEATRAAKAARMEEVMRKSMDEGRSSDAAEAEEFDTLEQEIKTIDEDLVRLKRLETLNVQRGREVQATRASDNQDANRAATHTRSTGPTIIVRSSDQDEKFLGQNYVRRVIAKTLAQIDGISAVAIAQHRWAKTNPTLVELIKADVSGAGSSGENWGADLVSADNRFTGDFIEYLNSMTIYNRLALREVPANVNIKKQDGAATGYWVGEGKAIPVSAADFNDVNLTPLKVAALAVASIEWMRDSSPSGEMLVRDALVEAAAQRIDTTFLGAGAAVAGVSPAGLLNGLTAVGTTGNDGDGVRADIKALYASFIAAKNAGGLTLVMNPGLAKALQLMSNALGQQEFPGITTTGGTLLGDPVVTGDNVNSAHVILLKPSDIYKIGDGGIQVSMSRDATIEMADNPAGDSLTPTGPTGKNVSMFQSDSVALKVVRSINFAKRRTSAVAYINDAAYGEVVTP